MRIMELMTGLVAEVNSQMTYPNPVGSAGQVSPSTVTAGTVSSFSGARPPEMPATPPAPSPAPGSRYGAMAAPTPPGGEIATTNNMLAPNAVAAPSQIDPNAASHTSPTAPGASGLPPQQPPTVKPPGQV